MANRASFKTKKEWLDYQLNYRNRNREKIRAYNRKYNQLWRKKNGYHSEEKYKKKHPEKKLAWTKLQRAIEHGLIRKESCRVCGNEQAQAHHPDYSYPLSVEWLCPLHHKERHLSTVV
jgi:hypothetical protein